MGYRWYDAHNVEPAYPFGFGLSYSNFSLNASTFTIHESSRSVEIEVTNNGDITGKEVVQLYLRFPESAQEPINLKGFQKVELGPQETKTVVFDTLNDRAVSIWDVQIHDWRVVQGEFTVEVGTSYKDTVASGTFTVGQSTQLIQ